MIFAVAQVFKSAVSSTAYFSPGTEVKVNVKGSPGLKLLLTVKLGVWQSWSSPVTGSTTFAQIQPCTVPPWGHGLTTCRNQFVGLTGPLVKTMVGSPSYAQLRFGRKMFVRNATNSGSGLKVSGSSGCKKLKSY